MTATEQIAADLTTVVNHVLRDDDHRYGVHDGANEHAHARLAVRVADAGLANPQELGTVIGWVLTAMRWTARHRALTNDEVLIYSAALRVADCLAMFDLLALLGQAIAAKDWGEARRQWLHLAPWHTSLIAAWPDAEYLNIILQDLTPTAIH
jgi:hypothetical protein